MLYIKRYNNIEEANGNVVPSPTIVCVENNSNNVAYGKINKYSKTEKLEKFTLAQKGNVIRIDHSYVNLDSNNNGEQIKSREYFPSNSVTKEYFKGQQDITNVSFGKEITTIETGAFSGCTSLTSVFIPKNISIIQNGAFNSCDNITDISIDSNNLLSINYETNEEVGCYLSRFSGCTSLTGLTFGPNVTRVYYGFFPNCTSLTTVRGDNVLGLGRDVFYGCTNLKYCYFPSLIQIGYECFDLCENVEIFDAPNLGTIDYGGFSNIGKSTENGIELGYFPKLKTVAEHAFTNSGFIEIYAPNANNLASQNTFYKIVRLKKITLGKINRIPSAMFRECKSLVDITINITKKQFLSYNPASQPYWSHQIPATCVIHLKDCDLPLTSDSPYRNGDVG